MPVLNGKVGEEVAVDKQREGALCLVLGVEGNGGELVVTVFFGIGLGGHAQAVASSSGVASRGLCEALLEARRFFLFGLLPAYLDGGGLWLIGYELAVLSARTGAVGQAVSSWLGKQSGVVRMCAGNNVGRVRRIREGTEHAVQLGACLIIFIGKKLHLAGAIDAEQVKEGYAVTEFVRGQRSICAKAQPNGRSITGYLVRRCVISRARGPNVVLGPVCRKRIEILVAVIRSAVALAHPGNSVCNRGLLTTKLGL